MNVLANVRSMIAQKKIARFAVIPIMCFMVLMPVSKPAHATGFPTVDIAAIVQSITGYIQQLADYAEQINQLATMGQQYSQMLTDFNQTLTEYSHFLNQVRSLESFVSAGEWDDFIRQTAGYYGDGELATVAHLLADSADFIQNTKLLLDTYEDVPITPTDVSNILTSIGGLQNATDFVDTYEQISNRYDRYIDLQKAVARNSNDSVTRQGDISNIGNRLQGLGQESDLATAQLMATQNQMALNQSEVQIRLLNQLLQQQGVQQAHNDSILAESMNKQIQRLDNYVSSYAPVTYGSDTFGNF